MAIYKIFRPEEWARFQEEGEFAGSLDDLRDGFIHLSTENQLEDTKARHFSGISDIVVVQVRVEEDTALEWEKSRNGELFPHLYRSLRIADLGSAN